MKNTRQAFTLVELIVVITILAILGTIAFVSLQGYSQDAKNSKVKSDVRTLVSAIETGLTKGSITLSSINDNSKDSTNQVDTSKTITYKDTDWNSQTWALSSVTYHVGLIDFAALGQNGQDFKDPEGKPYLIATAYTGATAYYQVVGQTKNAGGTYNAVVRGTYFSQNGTDAEGLATGSGDNDNWLKDGEIISNTTGLY